MSSAVKLEAAEIGPNWSHHFYPVPSGARWRGPLAPDVSGKIKAMHTKIGLSTFHPRTRGLCYKHKYIYRFDKAFVIDNLTYFKYDALYDAHDSVIVRPVGEPVVLYVSVYKELDGYTCIKTELGVPSDAGDYKEIMSMSVAPSDHIRGCDVRAASLDRLMETGRATRQSNLLIMWQGAIVRQITVIKRDESVGRLSDKRTRTEHRDGKP